MTHKNIANLEEIIKQYETAIAFEIANPFDGKAQAIPYCFIPSAVKNRIEDGHADYLIEIQKLLAGAKAARQAAR